ncbi:hypothetical protein N431DRAFT_164474 [Stipitochalara longipes BDJ]|nr:hypothetical protein N431DRAFT_164474 [Stipitochalara longipes BDJ]
MLELLPGQDKEPIQIKLSHRPLADLPLCEALSYEWGSPTRDHEISCEGKSLKVTINLIAALKRLRPPTQGFRDVGETEDSRYRGCCGLTLCVSTKMISTSDLNRWN